MFSFKWQFILVRQLIPRLWFYFVDWQVMTRLFAGMDYFQGGQLSETSWQQLPHFFLQPLHESEKKRIATHFAFEAVQIMLLLAMWTTVQNRLKRQAKDSVIFSDIIETLPRYGLIRGTFSLFQTFITSSETLNTLKQADRNQIMPAVTTHLGLIVFIAILAWLEMRSLRVLALVLPLLYIDAITCLFRLYVASQILPMNQRVLAGLTERPQFFILSALFLHVSIFASFQMTKTWARWFLASTPLLSSGTLFWFLLTRHNPVIEFEPLPIQDMSMKPEFCQVCWKSILAKLQSLELPEHHKHDWGETSPTKHHRSTSSLRKSALEGCRICAPIWNRLSRKESSINSWPWYCATSFEFSYHQIKIHYKWNMNIFKFSLVWDDGEHENASLLQGPLSGCTGSVQSLDQAKKWLEDCVQKQDQSRFRSHARCSDFIDETFRPSRLLYLGGDPGSVLLHTQEEYPEQLKYMTLSHCWGASIYERLEVHNVSRFRHSIPLKSLPRTFQDAIKITRHLGCDYLWIDSLCIIQDSLEDWKTESVTMGDIYRNSLCNIAATTAIDSHEGCLYSRNPRLIQPQRLPWSSNIYLFNSSDLNAPYQLHNRAWVLQETLLAPRTLDCTRNQLYWRCNMMASEEFPAGFTSMISPFCTHPTNGISDDIFDTLKMNEIIEAMEKWQLDAVPISSVNLDEEKYRTRPFTSELFYLSVTNNGPAKYWGKIVDYYSRMSLTFETDRPIAITGILNAFRPFLGEYWAGMWQNLLPGHLIWRTYKDFALRNTSSCSRPPKNRAPSWSWLSLKGRIFYSEGCCYNARPEIMAALLGVQVLSDVDIQLRLRAPLLLATRVERYRSPSHWLPQKYNPDPKQVATPLIDNTNFRSKWDVRGSDGKILADKTHKIHVVFDIYAEEDVVGDVFLMAVTTHSGLVLRRNSEGHFTRLGTMASFDAGKILFADVEKIEFILV